MKSGWIKDIALAGIVALAMGITVLPAMAEDVEAKTSSGHGMGSHSSGGGHDYAGPTLEELGGAFTLTDQTGKDFSDQDLLGHYSLVYAGYMECLEACPMALGAIRSAAAELTEDGLRTDAVFIDIRAPRLDDMTGGLNGMHGDSGETHSMHHADGPKTGPEVRRAALREWTEKTGGGLITLSGTRKQVGEAVRLFQVRNERNMARNGEVGPRINHTTHVYVMGPDGAVAALFYHDTPVSDMVEGVRTLAAG